MASTGYYNDGMYRDDDKDYQDTLIQGLPQACFSQEPLLMLVKMIQKDPIVFMDPHEPIRYLGLYYGASLQLIEEFATHGRSFDQIFLCDKQTRTTWLGHQRKLSSCA